MAPRSDHAARRRRPQCAVSLGAAAQAQSEAPGGIEEIVVTATRREMNIQDVPQNIAAFSTDDIEKQAFQAMEDYVRALPSRSS